MKLIPFDLVRALAGDVVMFQVSDFDAPCWHEGIAVYKSKKSNMNNILVVFTKPDREYESNFWMKESDLFMKPKKKKLYIGIKTEPTYHGSYSTTHAFLTIEEIKACVDSHCDEFTIHEIEVEE